MTPTHTDEGVDVTAIPDEAREHFFRWLHRWPDDLRAEVAQCVVRAVECLGVADTIDYGRSWPEIQDIGARIIAADE